jgi:hypothetical protein
VADRFDGYKYESYFEEARLEIMKAFLRKREVSFLGNISTYGLASL